MYKETLEELDVKIENIQEKFDKEISELRKKRENIIKNDKIAKYIGKYFMSINEYEKKYYYIIDGTHNKFIFIPNKILDSLLIGELKDVPIYDLEYKHFIPITEEEFLKAKNVLSNILEYINLQKETL